MYQKSHSNDALLIVQCDSGHTNGDLIACAKYQVNDIIKEADFHQLQQADPPLSPPEIEVSQPRKEQPKGRLYVLFTIYLPRKYVNNKSSFVSILGRDWICTHIDDFFPVQPFSPVSLACEGMQLSGLFHKLHTESMPCDTPGARAQEHRTDKEKVVTHPDLKLYVHVQEAVKKARHLSGTDKRMQQVNEILLRLLRHNIDMGK